MLNATFNATIVPVAPVLGNITSCAKDVASFLVIDFWQQIARWWGWIVLILFLGNQLQLIMWSGFAMPKPWVRGWKWEVVKYLLTWFTCILCCVAFVLLWATTQGVGPSPPVP